VAREPADAWAAVTGRSKTLAFTTAMQLIRAAIGT
jgi:hypothetical protein